MTTHREHLRVHWVDTDAGGRIHHTAAFRWAELAEHGLYRSLGIREVGGFPRRHVEATYHLPLGFDDEITLDLTVEHVGTTSIRYAWRAERDGELCVEGRTVVVHVDEHGVPAPLPGRLVDGLKDLRFRVEPD